MERKNFLFKNIFYIFFALVFLGAGFLIFPTRTNKVANALNVQSQTVDNDSVSNHPYFARKEYQNSESQTPDENSLIASDIFMLSSDSENILKLSFDFNGGSEGVEDNKYNYVYYPDLDNKSVFYFFSNIQPRLTINGVDKVLKSETYVKTHTDARFGNQTEAPQEFSMTLCTNESAEEDSLSVVENGQVVEGLYTLTLQFTRHTCTNGEEQEENNFQFTSQNFNGEENGNPLFTYSFYVVDKDKYQQENSKPTIKHGAFDKDVEFNDTRATLSYALYSNFSSKGNTDKIPHIDFDYTRYEIDIIKDLTGESPKTAQIKYNTDFNEQNGEAPVVLTESSSDIVKLVYSTEKSMARLYFTDVGAYTLTLKAIKVVDFGAEQTVQKYDLNGLSAVTKRIEVHMFGYQANYTDFDAEQTSTSSLPLQELKDYKLSDDKGSVTDQSGEFVDGTFIDGADITSQFLSSNTAYAQGKNTTFTPTNVLGFLRDKTPVQTNQPPIQFTANATLANVASWIYTTAQINDFTDAGSTLNGDELYYSSFTGQTENTPGKYIYIIAYNYNAYRENENTQGTLNNVFYQVFYFEILKELKDITITASTTNKKINSNDFVNQNVVINDTTKLDKYNKDVTVQIYAYDFAPNKGFEDKKDFVFRSDFGGENGISLAKLDKSQSNTATLTESACYTIRLYYTNEIKKDPSILNIKTGKKYRRETVFTIDKDTNFDITKRNFEKATASSYKNHSVLTNFSTNQYVALSWKEKDSGAKTYAYYHYFPLLSGADGKYYPTSADEINSILEQMIQSGTDDNSYIPVNRVLNLADNTHDWLPYLENTTGKDTLSEQSLFTDPGLYVLDVYDEAGNHSYDLFVIDDSNPIFALYDTKYTIPSTSQFIHEKSTLYWGKYKVIYINGLENIFKDYTLGEDSDIDFSGVTSTVFTDKNGDKSKEIFKTIYQKLYQPKYIKEITVRDDEIRDKDGISSLISNYSGLYLAVPINNVTHMTDVNDPNNKGYVEKQNVYSQELNCDKEITYTVMIRDASNSKMNKIYNADALIQYTNYFSARQTIIVSFDDSKFFIQYKEGEETRYLTSNNTEIEELSEIEDEKHEKTEQLTTYLSPTRMSKALQVTFVPTLKTNKIQVESITMDFYAYEQGSKEVNGVTYYYRKLADNPTESNIELYKYNSDDLTQNSDDTKVIGIKLENNITTPGKYVITRTYNLDNENTYNDKDYYKRQYVLIVDRNEVISSQTPIGEHSESLVGGDIFVAMYDTGKTTDLVVTFPNSEAGNTNNGSFYNNGDVQSRLTTNKLPVNIYIPQYKYTTYVEKTETGNGYEFDVKYNFAEDNSDSMNFFKKDNLIKEYALYAELRRGSVDSSPIAVTSNSKNPTLENVQADENGFLKFYNYDNGETEFGQLTEAGSYFVTVYQGMFGEGLAENNYQQSITFQFDIIQTEPDFTVETSVSSTIGKRPLQSTLSPDSQIKETYYTNQSLLDVIWQHSDNQFMANIDVTKIHFSTASNTKGFDFNLNDPSDEHRNIWNNLPQLQSNGNYLGTIDLQKLDGVYQDGGYVEITMYYENHDLVVDSNGNHLYNSVTKRINVDLTAPDKNVEDLVDKSLQNSKIDSNLFNRSVLRSYQKANYTPTTDKSNRSYNLSQGSDSGNIFAYYSYVVTKDYINTLRQTTGDISTYISRFAEGVKYSSSAQQETSPSGFYESNYNNINDIGELEVGAYYEIVEMDRARNMAIYTIYVTDQRQSGQNLITYTTDQDEQNIVNYTSDDLSAVENQIGAINNIYARTGFKLQNIDFFGDVWSPLTVKTYSRENGQPISTTRTLMLSPWQKGYAYVFVGQNTPQTIDIRDLIDGTQSLSDKHCITITNRLNQTETNFYVNIRNIGLNHTMSNTANREFISFTNVSDAQLQNTTQASNTPFVVSMKISVNGNVIYADENGEAVQNKLGYAQNWKNFVTTTSAWNETETIRVMISGDQLVFEINPNLSTISPNDRILYEFTDNYGQSYSEVHLYHESIISREIGSESEQDKVYAYYDENGDLIYIVRDGFQYTFNTNKYSVEAKEVIIQNTDGATTKQTIDLTNASENYSYGSNGTQTNTYNVKDKTKGYNLNFVLYISDVTTQKFIKSIQFKLYDELLRPNSDPQVNTAGQYKILNARGEIVNSQITNSVNGELGYFSQLRIQFNRSETFIPVKVWAKPLNEDVWQELTSGSRLQNVSGETETWQLKIWYDTHLENHYGNAQYVFEDVPDSQIYSFNLTSLTSYYWVEKITNGTRSVVQKSGTIYRAEEDNTQYSNHYIVNEGDRVEIMLNSEQNLTYEKVHEYEKNNVRSEKYRVYSKENSQTKYETYLIVTYIPNVPNFVTNFYTYNTDGVIDTNNNLANKNSANLIIPDGNNLDRVQLQWSKYNALPENEISIEVTLHSTGLEGGQVVLSPTVYTGTRTLTNGTTSAFNYIYLTNSGMYTIKFVDVAGNVNKFKVGNDEYEQFTFVFLKDVPFTITYTNPLTQQQETSLPIKQAIYNGAVTINVDKNTYTSAYYSIYPALAEVKRNGVVQNIDSNDNTSFNFVQSGYYEIKFSAQNNNQELRSETYQFTIINPDEYKISYVYNRYSNYYVEKVLKNGNDITEQLIETLDIATVLINGKHYLTELPISYLDEKTGEGEYTITINSNNRLLKDYITTFTFVVKIYSGTAPLQISLKQGDSTTGTITILYNPRNIFLEMGESTLRIAKLLDDGNIGIGTTIDINSQSAEIGQTLSINSTGTYFIQIISPSGNLLFSYKVVRNEPMNAASIIAIVISAVVLVAIIFIIIKLRKRISVK